MRWAATGLPQRHLRRRRHQHRSAAAGTAAGRNAAAEVRRSESRNRKSLQIPSAMGRLTGNELIPVPLRRVVA